MGKKQVDKCNAMRDDFRAGLVEIKLKDSRFPRNRLIEIRGRQINDTGKTLDLVSGEPDVLAGFRMSVYACRRVKVRVSGVSTSSLYTVVVCRDIPVRRGVAVLRAVRLCVV